MKSVLLLFLTFSLSIVSYAQQASVVGKWKTIDDKTGKQKSIVELYKYEGQLYGKITYLYPREGRPEHPVCEKCTDDRKDKPLIGLQIVRNLKWNGTEWAGGTICDPEIGKVYRTKMWIDEKAPNKLNVRGYLGPFYRTQTWIREDN